MKNNYKYIASMVSLALMSFYTHNALAETSLLDDASLTLGDIDVSSRASGALSAKSISSSVDILPEAKIENQVVTHTWELFEQMPGVMLEDFNQGNVSGHLSFRGFNGEGQINAVKLLIDGVPSNTNTGNMEFLEIINPLDIQSIEMVRGTNDPRYGMYNIAGNVDIKSRIGGNYKKARLSYGSFNSLNLQGAAGFENDNGFSQNYSVSYVDGDGYRDHSDNTAKSLAGKWFYTTESGDTSLGLIARHYESDALAPGYLTEDVAKKDPTSSPSYSGDDEGNRKLDQVSFHIDSDLRRDISLSSVNYFNRIDDVRYARFSVGVSQQERDTYESHYGSLNTMTWRPEVSWVHSFSLMGGVSIEAQDNKSERYLTADQVRTSQTRNQKYDLSIYGGFIEAVIKPTEKLKLVPAFRVDKLSGDFTDEMTQMSYDINDYGVIQQPKFSAVYSFTKQYAAYVNWGKTFQVGVGSSTYKIDQQDDLSPSINEGWEAGFKFQPSQYFNGRVAVWRQDASNEAQRVLNDPNNSSDNIGQTRREGVDLQFNVLPTDKLTLWMAGSLQRAKIVKASESAQQTEGNEIDHTPNYIVNAGVDYQANQKVRLSVWSNTQDDYYLTKENDTNKYGGYTLVNASARYAVSPNVAFELQLKNMFDRYYEYVWSDGTQTLHSPGNGRAVYGSVQLDF